MEMRNVMRQFIETISTEEHFTFLTRGVCRLLNNPYEETWMPRSQKRVELTRGNPPRPPPTPFYHAHVCRQTRRHACAGGRRLEPGHPHVQTQRAHTRRSPSTPSASVPAQCMVNEGLRTTLPADPTL